MPAAGLNGNGPLIAIVEDEPDQRESMVEFLQANHHRTWAEDSAEAFYRRMLIEPADIIILDLCLPGEDGLKVASHVREAGRGIIIVSGRGDLVDRIAGLQAGADAFLTKPVNVLELEAQILTLWRRLRDTLPTEDVARPLWQLQQADRRLVTPDGLSIHVTPTEFSVLRAMASQGGCLSRSEVAALLDRNPGQFNFHRIDVMLNRLRRKVERETGAKLPLLSAPRQQLEFTCQLQLV